MIVSCRHPTFRFGSFRANSTMIPMKRSLYRTSIRAPLCALVLIAGLSTNRLHAQSNDTIGPVVSFRNEIMITGALRTSSVMSATRGMTLDLFHFSTSRLHDAHHRTLVGEEIAGPLTFIHLQASYQPNREFEQQAQGVGIVAEGAKALGGAFALGGIAAYNRTPLPEGGGSLIDFELGPQLAYWTSERTYLATKLEYRRVTHVDAPVSIPFDDFIEIRNHVTYVPSETWTFSYSQDLAVRVGLRDTPHANGLSIDNSFLFSLSPRITWGVKAGVDLSYFVVNKTALITIPIGARMEIFPTGLVVVTAQILYDLPTMIRQQTGGVSVSGGVGFRF